MKSSEKAVITVIGKDMFAMVMLVDMGGASVDVAALSSEMDRLGDKMGLKIHVMHEDIFHSMHRV